ncbi:GAF domain-containing protein [Sphingorhabdus soli]|uniref:GAF domain-containing protein n=1 Tax=Flavisphingopyxis soli TaxID=2601267 RepID=A0A5C6UB92_9SPHN|nr:GAF domain-containing protein [Sphingorhabdus soli]TXC69155.1 GAF domain-containing protein [Sphingorhabdus soli]
MTIPLSQLEACFAGVVPSIIATRSAEGVPNISYLSQVVMVDDRHIALTNQFLSKTAANIRSNPVAALMIVDGRTGRQYALDIVWRRSDDRGPLFDRVERDLTAHSAQVGMADIMRLRALEVFEVLEVRACEAGTNASDASQIPVALLAEKSRVLAMAQGTEEFLDRLLEVAATLAQADRAMILLVEQKRKVLVVMGSLGYQTSGVGSEVVAGDGLIGQAAANRETTRISDISRIHRLSHAVVSHTHSEASLREIAFPRFNGAISQVAVPLISSDEVTGVLFLESSRRYAFDMPCCSVLETLANHAASGLRHELHGDEEQGVAVSLAPALPERALDIAFYDYDGSIFIANEYAIKGVAGRLLLYMLEKAAEEGRRDFTNREIRLAPDLRLPDFKDNLETRLLLLKRRLQEREFGVKVVSAGRGRLELTLEGIPRISRM